MPQYFNVAFLRKRAWIEVLKILRCWCNLLSWNYYVTSVTPVERWKNVWHLFISSMSWIKGGENLKCLDMLANKVRHFGLHWYSLAKVAIWLADKTAKSRVSRICYQFSIMRDPQIDFHTCSAPSSTSTASLLLIVLALNDLFCGHSFDICHKSSV